MNSMEHLSGRHRAKPGEVQFPLAEAGDGRVVHISAVREKSETYRCPACRDEMFVHMGRLRAHHFAHASNTDCIGGLETALHRLAKEMLPPKGALAIPELRVDVGRTSAVIQPASMFVYDDIRLEYRVSEVVPDIVLRRGRSALCVEIAVTHRCDEAKLGKLRAMEMPAIEIDLSPWAGLDEMPDIFALVSRDARRAWLFHPDQSRALAALQAEIEGAKQRRQAAHEREALAKRRIRAAEYAKGAARAREFIARSAERTLLIHLTARSGRETHLERAAERVFGNRALDWITHPNPFLEGHTPRAQARDSVSGLGKALDALRSRSGPR
jgi:hypothetical protein